MPPGRVLSAGRKRRIRIVANNLLVIIIILTSRNVRARNYNTCLQCAKQPGVVPRFVYLGSVQWNPQSKGGGP